MHTLDKRNCREAITQQSFANALIEESAFNATVLLDRRCLSACIGSCTQSSLIYEQYDSYGNLQHRRNAIAGVDESFVMMSYTDSPNPAAAGMSIHPLYWILL
ncbi:hypothetical protein ACJJID_08970 [Microbulbifer sp. CnH-101-G]|uniref:hypothetical protein n=1 Tax=Microbulbifer sp. CnH-101-G TaxID=3243393 RepID=UPI0040395809